MQLLTFTMNKIDYGIPLSDVESIETIKDVSIVPTAPAHIRGVIRLHGQIIPVFSLASRFGLGDLPASLFIVVNADGIKLALEVEQVKEIVGVEDRRVLPMPSIMNGQKNCFNDVASCPKELIVMLDVRSLVTMEEKEQIRQMVEKQEAQ